MAVFDVIMCIYNRTFRSYRVSLSLIVFQIKVHHYCVSHRNLQLPAADAIKLALVPGPGKTGKDDVVF